MSPFRALMRVPVPWVFVLVYLAGAWLDSRRSSAATADASAAVTIVGGVLLAAGALIAVWCLIIFHRARTTTVPGQTSVKLVTWGPYQFTRNPMYVGLTLAYLGEAGLLKHIWPVVLLPLVIAYLNWTVIPVEEARLSEVFQDEYDRYRARVRRWI
jgi:protein-S-isoprenylcysteine O-methyltransferase Ste14